MSDTIKKILLVDDDKEILENLSYVLQSRHNIEVDTLTSGNEVAKKVTRNAYDAVVIDLMLPGIDGHKVCREIREISDLPIVMITALQEVSERLLAFELGVDDFLVKPFNINELVARIEAIHKRVHSEGKAQRLQHTIYHFENWKLNTATFKLHSPNEVEVALSSSDFKLLETFLEHPNRVLSRDYLVDYIQNRSRDVFDRSIDVRVSLLRKKLQGLDGSDDNKDKFIKTIHNQGYLFTAKVRKEKA